MKFIYADAQIIGQATVVPGDVDPDGARLVQDGRATMEDGTVMLVVRRGDKTGWGPWEAVCEE